MTKTSEESLLAQARAGVSRDQWRAPEDITGAEREAVAKAWIEAERARTSERLGYTSSASLAWLWEAEELPRAVSKGVSRQFLRTLFRTLLGASRN